LDEKLPLLGGEGNDLLQSFEKMTSIFKNIVEGEEGKEESSDKGGKSLYEGRRLVEDEGANLFKIL
jgi:hypothetical protein